MAGQSPKQMPGLLADAEVFVVPTYRKLLTPG
jgi:hypothetical protein